MLPPGVRELTLFGFVCPAGVRGVVLAEEGWQGVRGALLLHVDW